MYLERQHTDMWFSQQDMERRWNSDDQQTELRSKPKEISGSEEIQSDALPRKMWWHQWVRGDYSRAWGWSLLCKYRVLLRLLLLLNFIFFLPTINSYDFFLSYFQMSSSVSQEVVSTTRSQPEVETTDAIFGIITGGMHYKQFIKIWLYHNAYLFIQIKCYG